MKRIFINHLLMAGTLSISTSIAVGQISSAPKTQPRVGSNKVVARSQVPQLAGRTGYDQLLIKYLLNIDRLARDRDRKAAEDSAASLKNLKSNAASIDDREGELLIKLRENALRRPRKTLTFEGNAPEYEAFNPASESSARIFKSLIAERLVEEDVLLSGLSGQHLSSGWVSYLQGIAGETLQTSELKESAIKSLFEAGIEVDRFRAPVLNMAVSKSDLRALRLLLFSVDASTGRVSPRISRDNLDLARLLCAKDRDPEVRIVCARYAAEINDYDLAHSVCEDLLTMRYRGLANPEAPIPDPDLKLFRARNHALTLLFYTLQNERAFKQVYNRSRINKFYVPAELAERDARGKLLASFRAYPLGKMEAEFAESLVKIVYNTENSNS